ncbi:MAG: beta-1,6-N-acetylglucosaminyltransferase [Bacillota bacterium]|nr:beta-1,6-N-acetylglucosaminyltransferase [Bacillota bacterium]
MKQVFMIMFHNNFDEVKRLIKFLDTENSYFILGIDKNQNSEKTKNEIMSTIRKGLGIYIPLTINWGAYSSIDATLNMLHCAQSFEYEYVHFITGADVPLMERSYMDEFLKENRGREFIEYAPHNYSFAYYKCDYYHMFTENKIYRNSLFLKILNHAFVRLQKVLGITRGNNNLYHGSAYFTVTRECATYILENRAFIKRLCKHSLGADEVWVQTLIANSPFRNMIYDFECNWGNLRYIDWENREGNSPHTFVIKDMERLEKVLNTKYFFGRKFNANKDKEIIDALYNKLY